MKTHKVLITVTILIVIIIGSVPGLATLLIDTPGPFTRDDGPYWHTLVCGIPSIIVGILIGYLVSKHLLRIWFKIEKKLVYKSIVILLITFISGVITLLIAWEVNWIVPRFFGWGNMAFNPWENLLDHILLGFIYCSIPVGIVGILNGLFSFIYLKLTK